MRMENSEGNEVSEGTKDALEAPPLETPEAKEVLESTEKTLCESFATLSSAEKLNAICELEVKCADLEGRNPRAVELGKLKQGDFNCSNEKVTVDSSAISKMSNISAENLDALKKEVFSSPSKLAASHRVSFGYSDCNCSGSCRGDCSGSSKCYSYKG